ncbi:unnamed protein product [Closterium sp. NIES-54]
MRIKSYPCSCATFVSLPLPHRLLCLVALLSTRTDGRSAAATVEAGSHHWLLSSLDSMPPLSCRSFSPPDVGPTAAPAGAGSHLCCLSSLASLPASLVALFPQQTEDLLLHLQWLDRTTQAVEEDMVVFPDEAKFEKASWGSGLLEEDDRVLDAAMMDSEADAFAENEEGHLGEADMHDDGDSHQVLAPAVQDVAAQQPRPAGSSGAVTAGPQGPSGLSDLRGSVSAAGAAGAAGVDASHAAAPAPGAPGGAAAAAAAAAAAGRVGGPVQLAQLQSILAGLGQIQVPQHLRARSMKLTDILKPEVMMSTLNDGTVQQRLAEFLPPAVAGVPSPGPPSVGGCQKTCTELRKPEDMRQLVLSPQFQQQLDTFSEVLLAGKIDLSQFGIDVNKYGYGVVSFLEAIEDTTPAPSAMATIGEPASDTPAAAAVAIAPASASVVAPSTAADGEASPQRAAGVEPGDRTVEKKEEAGR